MLQKNDIVDLTITDMTHEGSGVGHLKDGMTVFVPSSAIGDKLSVRVLKVNKTHCFGKIEQIVTPSPDRIKSDCAVSKRCGGCVFRHVSYEAELRYKQDFVQKNLQRIGGFDLICEPIVPSPAQEGYRNKAQYPVRMQKNGICAGFFAPRTHDVIDCHDCKLQPVIFKKILETVLEFVKENKISIYDEATQKGLLRHVYLRSGYQSGEIMVCLVINGTSVPKQGELVERLLACTPEIVSVVLNQNNKNTNVILGNENRVLFGKPGISDVLCGVRFDISPLAFYQVNAAGAERLYGIASEFAELTGNETLIDLYCGAGTIGLSMARHCKEVIGVEIIPQAVENAKANAVQNGIVNVHFFCADAAAAALQLERDGIRPDVVVLDPPRKGCEQSVLDSVAKMSPRKVVMVSCNSATLARDCAALEKLGYALKRCRPVDMFPRTPHVETVVQLSRKTPDDVIHVDLDLTDLPLTKAEAAATYTQIKEYVLEQTGMKVSSLYVSQVKRKCGLEVGDSYNKPKSDDKKQPQCPPDKEAAIMAALQHYKMI